MYLTILSWIKGTGVGTVLDVSSRYATLGTVSKEQEYRLCVTGAGGVQLALSLKQCATKKQIRLCCECNKVSLQLVASSFLVLLALWRVSICVVYSLLQLHYLTLNITPLQSMWLGFVFPMCRSRWGPSLIVHPVSSDGNTLLMFVFILHYFSVEAFLAIDFSRVPRAAQYHRHAYWWSYDFLCSYTLGEAYSMMHGRLGVAGISLVGVLY